MEEITEVTAQNLRELRIKRGLNQEELAAIIGLQKHNISKLETGTRSLSPSEKALLDLYFFGTLPFEIANEKLLRGVLDFSDLQWRAICILATAQGITPGRWIAREIQNFLNYTEEGRAAMWKAKHGDSADGTNGK